MAKDPGGKPEEYTSRATINVRKNPTGFMNTFATLEGKRFDKAPKNTIHTTRIHFNSMGGCQTGLNIPGVIELIFLAMG